jgi:hypothetical protein
MQGLTQPLLITLSLLALSAIGLGLLTGADNIAIGRQAGYDLTSGIYNVFQGYQAGQNATTANYTIAIGYNAIGGGVLTGTRNIALAER